MKLLVKNMVCDRCKMVVGAELEKLGHHASSVELGEVVLDKDLSETETSILDSRLKELGFSIIKDKKTELIEKIKTSIIELVHQHDNKLNINLSDFLSARLNHDYNYLTKLYSETEGTTIEKYFIAQKIEKVKELLEYDELTLSEIAYKLNYSSVAHLSNQFKKVAGLTPSEYKNNRIQKRKPLDNL
jgi:AraC-like DNA-binding protein